MKHKNVEVGQRVIIKRSKSDLCCRRTGLGATLGEEFRVVNVELPALVGDTEDAATVQVENSDSGVAFWCNHRDLKLVKEEAPISGALFVVTGCTTLSHCFDVGTVVRCANLPMGTGGNWRYEDNDGELQFVSPSDLKSLSLADIQAALDK